LMADWSCRKGKCMEIIFKLVTIAKLSILVAP